MKLFTCQCCGSMLPFEGARCGGCGRTVGFLPTSGVLSALEPDGDGWRVARLPGVPLRLCGNAALGGCNWLVDGGTGDAFCAACRHNRIIPDLTQPRSLARWRRLEEAKHRLFFSLIRLGIALPNKIDDPAGGLAFDFKDEWPGERVMTGHIEGTITVAAAEADDAVREGRRAQMHETYRTLLGHLRHEVGHWIWNRLVRDAGRLAECRAIFGDDTAPYDAALARYYRDGPPADWRARTISAYAASHPWEDFAETWAHYLHIMDTLETGAAFRIAVGPAGPVPGAALRDDPYETDDFGALLEAWAPLVLATNSLNRSMGLADFYPFAIGGAVARKLAFMHGLARSAAP